MASSPEEHQGESQAFDPGAMIMHHIADSHEWHFFDGATLPLPVILYSSVRGLEIFPSSRFIDAEHRPVAYQGYVMEHDHISSLDGQPVYDLSITKNVASMLVSVVLMFGVFFTIAARYKKDGGKAAPKGVQSFFEPIIIFIRDDIAKQNIGHKYERFMPYLLTVFFFIWFNNLLGLMPGSANLTGNIAVTLVLAIFTFLITQFSGTKDYWGHIFNTPGVPWWLKWGIPIMPVVEFIGIFTKPFSLMVRLFANITAGHIIILSLFSLIFIFQSPAIGPLSVAFATFMNFLELFVALLQAYIFTLLSAMYFGTAVEEHHHEHDHEEGHDSHQALA
ncbi:MAG: F0F1 ATP synthase subunit A [Cytophagales bacterium]|nr:F0F1 ATP synthase subunit A [Cytophagales bacterium]